MRAFTVDELLALLADGTTHFRNGRGDFWSCADHVAEYGASRDMSDWLACETPRQKAEFLAAHGANTVDAHPHMLFAVPNGYAAGARDMLAYLMRTGAVRASEARLTSAGCVDAANEARAALDGIATRLVRLLEAVPDGHHAEPLFSAWIERTMQEAKAHAETLAAQRQAEQEAAARKAEAAARVQARRDGRR